jgi:hypothetical protein
MTRLLGVRDDAAQASRDVAPNPLADLLRNGVRPWGAVPVRLSRAVTAAFWGLAVLDITFVGWLLAVRAGAAACVGPACAVATLGDQPLSALILALSCAAALAVAALSTRGLRQADGWQMAVIVAAGLCGVIALTGVVALLIGAVLCLATALAIFVVVADRL